MLNKRMESLIDIATLIWLISFICSFFASPRYANLFEYITIGISIFFILELILLFKNKKSVKDFLKNNWFDILMVIPVFRIFRIAKFMKIRKVSRFMKFSRNSKSIRKIPDFIDLTSKTSERLNKHFKEN